MAKKNVVGRYSRRVKHGDSDTHDLCLCTRKSSRILLDDLAGLWGGKSDGQERLALFLLYNKKSFSFLSIDTRLAEDGIPALIFEAAEKVGCAPLYSPVNGKICASIIVKGNMNEDVSEILPLIEEDIRIDFSPNLVFPYNETIKPPLYFECAKYIDQYIKAQRIHWQKFVSEVKVEQRPASSTQWTKYASKSYDPREALRYPNKKNLLSINHTEWRELNYVLKTCLEELCSHHTPRVSKRSYKTIVEDLRRRVDFREVIKPIELKIHTADPLEIKKLKEIGNRILHSNTSEFRAWSLDFSRLFECYVQYVFTLFSKMIGAHSYSNSKFSISGQQREWGLAYLEPDIILCKGNNMIVADAKYKMHMYNFNSIKVNDLKESFRHDFHQILAYSSFEKESTKTTVLVYPYNSFKCIKQKISNPFTSCVCNAYLVGIPWGNIDSDNSISINEKINMAVMGLHDLLKDL